jgi:hypothetical protein
MKRKRFGILAAQALSLVLALVLAGCDNTNSPVIETYRGTADSIPYTLVITDGAAYELTLGTGNTAKKSTGSVTNNNGGTYILQPDTTGANPFSVTVSGSDISAITGTITLDGGGTQQPPASIAPSFRLRWGLLSSSLSYSDIQAVIAQQQWTIADYGANWALGTGSIATTIYNWCNNPSNIPVDYWYDNGEVYGSFEELKNFSMEGVGLPAGLKSSPSFTGASVPLAGIYNGGSLTGYMTVLFYVTKN